MSSLGFTSKEQRNLGLLVHLMTTNPKILYSPIGSEVDKVIQKASSCRHLNWFPCMSKVIMLSLNKSWLSCWVTSTKRTDVLSFSSYSCVDQR